MTTDVRHARDRMVDIQISPRGIHDERVLRAMRRVPREAGDYLDAIGRILNPVNRTRGQARDLEMAKKLDDERRSDLLIERLNVNSRNLDIAARAFIFVFAIKLRAPFRLRIARAT